MPGITESYGNQYSQEEENSGFGLYVASEICDILNGGFSILSGDTLLRKRNGTVSTMQGFHRGSIIKMMVSTSQNFKYSNLIENIVKKGEQEMRGVNKASGLSKGKFLIK